MGVEHGVDAAHVPRQHLFAKVLGGIDEQAGAVGARTQIELRVRRRRGSSMARRQMPWGQWA
jgi:hypothetical protein